MKITEYAKGKFLDGSLITSIQADIVIKFTEHYGDLYADIYLTEKNGTVSIFEVEDGIPIHTGSDMDRGELRIQSPNGLISIPVELDSNE